MRYVRLDLLALEERRAITDELTLYKIYSSKMNTVSINQIKLNARTRFTRQNNLFYLPHVTTYVEYFSPMIRMQWQHDESFNVNSLNEECFIQFIKSSKRA